MTLTSEQIKTAKTICKENGLNPKAVSKELGNGFWAEQCKSSFEVYIFWLLVESNKYDGSIANKIMLQSTMNYRNGKSGLSSL